MLAIARNFHTRECKKGKYSFTKMLYSSLRNGIICECSLQKTTADGDGQLKPISSELQVVY